MYQLHQSTPPTQKFPSAPKSSALTEIQATGVVKWFDRTRGVGFITQDSGRADAFVHYSNIDSGAPGQKNLWEGERVRYDVADEGRGPQARKIRVIR